jgi:hypothetical protein
VDALHWGLSLRLYLSASTLIQMFSHPAPSLFLHHRPGAGITVSREQLRTARFHRDLAVAFDGVCDQKVT